MSLLLELDSCVDFFRADIVDPFDHLETLFDLALLLVDLQFDLVFGLFIGHNAPLELLFLDSANDGSLRDASSCRLSYLVATRLIFLRVLVDVFITEKLSCHQGDQLESTVHFGLCEGLLACLAWLWVHLCRTLGTQIT